MQPVVVPMQPIMVRNKTRPLLKFTKRESYSDDCPLPNEIAKFDFQKPNVAQEIMAALTGDDDCGWLATDVIFRPLKNLTKPEALCPGAPNSYYSNYCGTIPSLREVSPFLSLLDVTTNPDMDKEELLILEEAIVVDPQACLDQVKLYIAFPLHVRALQDLVLSYYNKWDSVGIRKQELRNCLGGNESYSWWFVPIPPLDEDEDCEITAW